MSIKYKLLIIIALGFCAISCDTGLHIPTPSPIIKPEPEPEPEPNMSISLVEIDGVQAKFKDGISTFVVVFPTQTDFSKCKVNFTFTGDKLTLNGKEIENPCELDLTESTVITVWDRTYSCDYTISAINTGLPIVYINTPKAIADKTNWVEESDIRIVEADGTENYSGTMSIRGRGNSTWNYPKKPYAIKLDSKSSILGMPKHKRWVLLANWKDRTLLRNDAAFWLSRHTSGIEYTVRGEFVELVLNGKHQGNYYLCEQIKLDKNRVNAEGGYLLELDTYFDEVNKFKSASFGMPYMIKDPDEEELTPEAFAYIQDYVNGFEASLLDEEKLLNHEYEDYFDVDSSIDVMLVQELTGNVDFFSSWPETGPHSFYMYKPVDGKMFTGPVWDFDYSTFVPNLVNTWIGADKNKFYYKTLCKDSKYKNRMLNKWDEQKTAFLELVDYIDQRAEYIRLSEEINQQMWPITNTENGDETLSYQQAINRMKNAFLARHAWIDKHLKDL